MEENHFFTEYGYPIVITEDVEYIEKKYLLKDAYYMLANDDELEVQSDDYQ